MTPKNSVEIRATTTVTEKPEMGTRRWDIVVVAFLDDSSASVEMVELSSAKLIEELEHPSIDVSSDWKSSDFSAVDTMTRQRTCPTIKPSKADFPLTCGTSIPKVKTPSNGPERAPDIANAALIRLPIEPARKASPMVKKP